MATYHGKNGSVTIGGVAKADLQSWDLTTTVDLADTTAMQATNSWGTTAVGLTDFNANIEFLTASADDAVAFSIAAGALVMSAGNTTSITGTGIAQTLTETVSIDDVSRITIAYEGNDNDGLTIA